MRPYYETKLGKLYHSDCLEIMPKLEPVDLVLADPPYNIGQKNKRTKVGKKIISNHEAWGEWDDFDNKEFDQFMFNFLQTTYETMINGAVLYCFTAREKMVFIAIMLAIKSVLNIKTPLQLSKTIRCHILQKQIIAVLLSSPFMFPKGNRKRLIFFHNGK